jgi:hypothetical protein
MIRPLFFGGKEKCLTFSYDDAVTQDRRLVELFNRYGVRGTFNLNSGCFGKQGTVNYELIREATHNKIEESEVAALYKGHEVAVHTVTHPNLCLLDHEAIRYEVMEDRKNLERLVGYPVTGMAYPYGAYDDTVIEVLKDCGIHYSRTVVSTNTLGVPRDFLMWHPTCHFGDEGMEELVRCFLNDKTEQCEQDYQKLLYIWGHSYELDGNETWQLMEDTLQALSGKDDIWYATNIEIYDYQKAVEALDFSADHTLVKNPSGQTVWISVDGKTVEIPAGEIVRI